MLAYRHAFHAGNHADVLKHVVLTSVLRYMAGKDKPYTLVDTHAGAGGYSLEGRYAKTKGEFEEGVGRLWPLRKQASVPAPVADYLELVSRFNSGSGLKQYPGSPAFAQLLLRPQDRLRLYELHATDSRILEAFLGSRPETTVLQTDGFESLKAELPPPSRRGVVLMDPSYELNADYQKLVLALRLAVKRYAEGVYMVWYPQINKLESSQLPERLQALSPKGWLHARLTVQSPGQHGIGLTGSGMFIINPPFTLHEELLAVLPYLVEVLGQFDGASYVLEQRAG